VADAPQEVVLRRVQLEELDVLGLHPGEELCIPDRDRDLAREQVEEILVGALPATRRRQASEENADGLPPDAELRPNRPRLAGDALLQRDLTRVDEHNDGVDHAERLRRVACGTPGQPIDPVARRRGLDRVEDPAQLAVAPLEVRGEPVVALREAGEFILARDLDARREVAARHALDGRGDGAERAREVRGEQVGDEHAQQRRNDDREQQQAAERRVAGARHDVAGEDDDPEAAERKHRSRDQRQREARPEGDGRAEPLGRGRRVDRLGWAVLVGVR
jgi:hypothetical protein